MGNLHALGIHELTLAEQRELVGGGGWLAKAAGWVVGAAAAGVVNLGEAIGEAAGEFVNGVEAGYRDATT